MEHHACYTVVVIVEGSCYHDVDVEEDEDVDVRCKENVEICFLSLH